MLGTGYEFRVVAVSQKEIDQFVPIEHARYLRPGQVRLLKKSIEVDGVRMSITVNLVGSRYRVIDGWHRITAIRELFLDGTLTSILLPLRIFHGLSKEQELHEHELLNTQIRHTATDFLWMHQDDLPVLRELVAVGIPLKTWSRADGFGTADLIRAYMDRSIYSRTSNFHEVIDGAKRLKATDANEILGFLQVFVDAFGAPTRSNWMTHGVILQIIAKMYWTNRDRVSREEMVRRLRKCSTDDILRKLMVNAGYRAAEEGVRRAIRLVNSGETVPFRVPRHSTRDHTGPTGSILVSDGKPPFDAPTVAELRKAELVK